MRHRERNARPIGGLIPDRDGTSRRGLSRAKHPIGIYIRQLRAKIDEPYTQNLIHTVRRTGYTLSEQDEN